MTFSEFWALTPADVLLATEAYDRRERAAYWRAGLMTAAIYNVNRPKGKRLLKPEDFVPRRRKRRQTAEQMAAMLQAFTLGLGGEVHINES